MIKKRHMPSARQLEQKRLTCEYAQLIDRLEQCRTNFSFVTEDEAIDALIFEENAILARMAAIRREAREGGYTAEIF